MDYFTKKGTIFWIFVLLTILNISTLATIGYHHFRRPLHPHFEHSLPRPAHFDKMQKRIENFYKKRLELTEQQSEQFKDLQSAHFQSIRSAHKKIRKAKRELFIATWKASTKTDTLQQLIQQINEQQRYIEEQHIEHIQALKEVCSKEQQTRLKKLISKSPLVRPHHGPPPLPPPPH